MSPARWLALVLAAIAGFFVAGIATFLLLLAFGQSLLGWHDNAGPEIAWSFLVGLLASVTLAAYLHGRWTPDGTTGRRP